MEIRKGFGGCFWITMFIFFLIGLATLPYGIAVWLIQLYIIYKLLRS